MSDTPLASWQASEIAAAKYAVRTFRITYTTVDGYARPVSASALVVVPQKKAGTVSPLLGLQHGTITRDSEAPSNHAQPSEPAIALASTGFIVAAPDYVGYAASKGVPHPYLLAAPSAAVVNDMWVAVRYWMQTQGLRSNGQLFMAGYSEGAYVTMAAYRALQQVPSAFLDQLQGVVLGAGPYNVDLTLNDLLDQIRKENALLGALINPGFLKYMGTSVRADVRNRLLDAVMGSGADVEFQGTFVDNFLADDLDAVRGQSDVYDWQPQKPIVLFHGRDDQLVSYRNATTTLMAMQSRGATGVTLKDCTAVPSDHLGCVGPYFAFLTGWLGERARDL